MVKKTDLYDVLNVSPDASAAEIKRAYRVLALKYHPDKNNHSEESKRKFQELSEAYEILNNEVKRRMYDRYGTVDDLQIQQQAEESDPLYHFATEGIFSAPSFFSSTMGMSAGDLFAQFFDNAAAGGSSGRKKRKPTRGPDIKHNLKCTLRELYHGKMAKLRLERIRLCTACSGTGGLQKTNCKTCSGRGRLSQTRYMGPVVQTFTQTCSDCNGSGVFVRRNDICQVCKGQGAKDELKIFEVEVKPGMRHGQTIVLQGEADEIINTRYGREKVIPGDVIIIVSQINDAAFEVINDCDLLVRKQSINIQTALCGGLIYISGHPSSKIIKIEILPGEIIKPGSIKNVEGFGMPQYESNNGVGSDIKKSIRPGMRGNLYIQFEVDFPDQIESDTISKLQEIFKQDKFVMETIKKEESLAEKSFGDCAEIEECVLSSFVPDYETVAQEIRNNKRRRKDSH